MAENHVLEIRHLSKSFGKHVVLRDIDFTVDTGGEQAEGAADDDFRCLALL